jgi:NitT/TauT family transport system permease protein
MRTARSALEIGTIVGLAAAIFFGLEAILRWTNTPTYVFPKPIDVVRVLWNEFASVFAHHLWVTMYEFLAGYAIGAAIGLMLAALITQKPFAEKVIAPYILIMVTTPMIALVPFLRLKMGFGSWPLIIAVALASGPMVMLNSATGFRRTDLAKIALARSYGASTLQIFRMIRFPLALPMIIVGFMVGSIFGLLTAVGGEMVAPSEAGGLGERLVYYSSLARMDEFGAVISIVAVLGVGIYVLFYFIGKRWASWEA